MAQLTPDGPDAGTLAEVDQYLAATNTWLRRNFTDKGRTFYALMGQLEAQEWTHNRSTMVCALAAVLVELSAKTQDHNTRT